MENKFNLFILTLTFQLVSDFLCLPFCILPAFRCSRVILMFPTKINSEHLRARNSFCTLRTKSKLAILLCFPCDIIAYFYTIQLVQVFIVLRISRSRYKSNTFYRGRCDGWGASQGSCMGPRHFCHCFRYIFRFFYAKINK